MERILHNQFLKLLPQLTDSPPSTIQPFAADATALNPLTETEQQGLYDFYHKVLQKDNQVFQSVLDLSTTEPQRFEMDSEWSKLVQTFLRYNEHFNTQFTERFGFE